MFFVYLGFSHAMWSYPILPSKVVWTFRMEYTWRKMIRGEEQILKSTENDIETGLGMKFLERVRDKIRWNILG